MRWIVYSFFLSFLLIAFVFAAHVTDIGSNKNDLFLAIMALVSAAVLWIPRTPRDRALFGITMLISWVGTFGGYQLGIGYDSFVHLLSSFISVLVFVNLFPLSSPKRTILLAVGLALTCGVVVELFEYLSDVLWQTAMSGEVGQPDDTLRDLVYDVGGTLLGAYAYMRFFKRKR